MTYIGEVKNGVVVLRDAPRLQDGTVVEVEVQSRPSEPHPGSAEALLKHAGAWADSAEEMDEALEYLRKTKWEEVQRQQAEPEDRL
jgi:hypothetical protein